MVSILGDVIKLTLPETTDSIVLFLDIRGQSSEPLKTKNPELTYIITTKGLDSYKELIDMGFFNILSSVKPSEVSQKLIVNFLTTKYADNRLRVILENLTPLYKEYGNTINCISALLTAIKTADLSMYETVIKYNLETMQAAIAKIEMMYTLAVALYSDRDKLEQMKASSELLVAKDSEISMYRKKIDEMLVDFENSKQDVMELTKQFKDAQKQIAELSTREIDITVVQSHPLFTELNNKLSVTSNALTSLTEEHKKLQIASGLLLEDSEGMDTKDRIITQLRKDLHIARSTTWDQLMDKKIPAVTDNVIMNAKSILYLKEIRTAIYMNSLVYWLHNYLTIKLQKEKKLTFLVIILDPLHNQHDRLKYAKRGWAINSTPNAHSSIVVTNEVSIDFLKGTIRIHEYDFIVVIDRFGLNKDTFETKMTFKYNLINTPTDVSDYKLDANKCIGFFSVPAKDKSPCRFNILPDDTMLFTYESARRSYKVAKDAVLASILKEIGVVEDV